YASSVLSAGPEVDSGVCAKLRGRLTELNQLSLDEVTFIGWVLITEQHDLPLVGRQPQSRRADLQVFRPRRLSRAGKADDQIDDRRSEARIGRPAVRVCVHAAAPEEWH